MAVMVQEETHIFTIAMVVSVHRKLHAKWKD